jgi:hypothetical protein
MIGVTYSADEVNRIFSALAWAWLTEIAGTEYIRSVVRNDLCDRMNSETDLRFIREETDLLSLEELLDIVEDSIHECGDNVYFNSAKTHWISKQQIMDTVFV